MAKFIEVLTLHDKYVLVNIDQITTIRLGRFDFGNYSKFACIFTNNVEIIETMHTYGELKAIFDKVLEPRCKAVMVDGDDEDDEDFQEVKRLEDLGHPGFNFEK